MKPTYKWTKTSAQNFSKTFETEQIKSEIKSFEQLLDSNDIELISSRFYQILHHACKRSLKKTKNVKCTVKDTKRDKLWYDMENEGKMRQYKLLCKNKRMLLWNKRIKQSNENINENNNNFWNNWKFFSENRISNDIDIKDGQTWEDYDRELYDKKETDTIPFVQEKCQINI